MPTALTFYRGRALEGRFSYDELRARVAVAAAKLYALGVRRGDRVAIASPNTLEVPVALLAIWRLGAVAVPLNPSAPPEDWQHILGHSGARGCLTSRELADAFSAGSLEFVHPLDDGWGHADPPAIPSASRDDPAIVLYTSGTTAQPKGVVLSQRNLLANAWSLARSFSLARTTQLAVLPLYHAHALGFGLLTALSTGGHLVFTDGLDPLAWAHMIRAESVAVASLVPPMLPLLLQARVRGAHVPSLRSLLVSSAPLSRDLAREVVERAELPLVNGWGLSEYTNFACCLGPRLAADERRGLLCDSEVPSVGAALEGAVVAVLDEAGVHLGENEPGELHVRGPSLMAGYFRDPEATAGTLRGQWLRTGDLGFFRLHRGVPHFFVTGRLKEIIIRGGEKYSPVAVEQRLLSELPELAGRLVVLGFPHSVQGEEVGAYVESGALPGELEVRILQAVQRLPAGMRPKVILHASLPVPKTHTGKVQRRKLQPLFDTFRGHNGPPRLVSSGARPGSAPDCDAAGRSEG